MLVIPLGPRPALRVTQGLKSVEDYLEVCCILGGDVGKPQGNEGEDIKEPSSEDASSLAALLQGFSGQGRCQPGCLHAMSLHGIPAQQILLVVSQLYPCLTSTVALLLSESVGLIRTQCVVNYDLPSTQGQQKYYSGCEEAQA